MVSQSKSAVYQSISGANPDAKHSISEEFQSIPVAYQSNLVVKSTYETEWQKIFGGEIGKCKSRICGKDLTGRICKTGIY